MMKIFKSLCHCDHYKQASLREGQIYDVHIISSSDDANPAFLAYQIFQDGRYCVTLGTGRGKADSFEFHFYTYEQMRNRMIDDILSDI